MTTEKPTAIPAICDAIAADNWSEAMGACRTHNQLTAVAHAMAGRFGQFGVALLSFEDAAAELHAKGLNDVACLFSGAAQRWSEIYDATEAERKRAACIADTYSLLNHIRDFASGHRDTIGYRNQRLVNRMAEDIGDIHDQLVLKQQEVLGG